MGVTLSLKNCIYSHTDQTGGYQQREGLWNEQNR